MKVTIIIFAVCLVLFVLYFRYKVNKRNEMVDYIISKDSTKNKSNLQDMTIMDIEDLYKKLGGN